MATMTSKKETARRLPGLEYRRALRIEAQLTLEQVASELAVHRSAVSRWERGLRKPQGRNRVAYASLLAELEEVVADV